MCFANGEGTVYSWSWVLWNDRSIPFIHRLEWDLPHQSWDHSVTDGKTVIHWIVLNYTLGSFIFLLCTSKGRLLLFLESRQHQKLGSGGSMWPSFTVFFFFSLTMQQREARNKWTIYAQKFNHRFFPRVRNLFLLSCEVNFRFFSCFGKCHGCPSCSKVVLIND